MCAPRKAGTALPAALAIGAVTVASSAIGWVAANVSLVASDLAVVAVAAALILAIATAGSLAFVRFLLRRHTVVAGLGRPPWGGPAQADQKIALPAYQRLPLQAPPLAIEPAATAPLAIGKQPVLPVLSGRVLSGDAHGSGDRLAREPGLAGNVLQALDQRAWRPGGVASSPRATGLAPRSG